MLRPSVRHGRVQTLSSLPRHFHTTGCVPCTVQWMQQLAVLPAPTAMAHALATLAWLMPHTGGCEWVVWCMQRGSP
eukprot:12165540-Alexandrium_andersonii.AAC.1